MTDDLLEMPPVMLEGWRQTLGLEVIPGETAQELRIRMIQHFGLPPVFIPTVREEPKEEENDDELRDRIMQRHQWMRGEKFEFEKGTDAHIPPRSFNCPCVSITVEEPKPEILDITRDFIKERL